MLNPDNLPYHDPFCSCRTTLIMVARGPSCPITDRPKVEAGAFIDPATGDIDYYPLDPVEQGRYDDDPNPYLGTYSEE